MSVFNKMYLRQSSMDLKLKENTLDKYKIKFEAKTNASPLYKKILLRSVENSYKKQKYEECIKHITSVLSSTNKIDLVLLNYFEGIIYMKAQNFERFSRSQIKIKEISKQISKSNNIEGSKIYADLFDIITISPIKEKEDQILKNTNISKQKLKEILALNRTLSHIIENTHSFFMNLILMSIIIVYGEDLRKYRQYLQCIKEIHKKMFCSVCENCKLINSLLELDEFEVLLSFGEKETNDLNNTLHVVPSKLVLNKTPKDNKSIIRKVTNSFKTTFINKTPIIKNLKSRNSLKFRDRDECSMNSIEKEIKVPESKFKKQGNVSNYHNYIKNTKNMKDSPTLKLLKATDINDKQSGNRTASNFFHLTKSTSSKTSKDNDSNSRLNNDRTLNSIKTKLFQNYSHIEEKMNESSTKHVINPNSQSMILRLKSCSQISVNNKALDQDSFINIREDFIVSDEDTEPQLETNKFYEKINNIKNQISNMENYIKSFSEFNQKIKQKFYL